MRTNRGSSKTAIVVSLLFTFVLFLAAGWVLFNRQYVIDQLVVWQYKPSAEIAKITDNTGLRDSGKFYFYASEPQLDGTNKFNQVCQRQEENSAILGCYTNGRIFIYDVKDERLNGVEEVTAAHEMLHAAYDRLSSGEKTRINTLLNTEYQKILTTGAEEFKVRMQYYARTEPGERDNELHSIIGTEVAELPRELEDYYARYFINRQQVVTFHDAYNSKFNELKQSSTSLKEELEGLSAEINAMTGQYNNDISVLNTDISTFNSNAEQGNFRNESDFQSARRVITERIGTLKQTRATIDAKVAEYEAKRQQYNATVDESNSLSRSLDSSLAPAPSI